MMDQAKNNDEAFLRRTLVLFLQCAANNLSFKKSLKEKCCCTCCRHERLPVNRAWQRCKIVFQPIASKINKPVVTRFNYDHLFLNNPPPPLR